MKIPKITLAVAGLIWLSLVPARADTVYDWTISEVSGDGISGSGTLTLSSTTTDDSGTYYYTLESLTGTVNGTGISGPISCCYAGADTAFYLSPYLQNGTNVNDYGIGFQIASGPDAGDTLGLENTGTYGDEEFYYGTSPILQGDLFTMTLTPVAATPIPASWSLLLTALAGLGFMAYRRQRQNTDFAPA